MSGFLHTEIKPKDDLALETYANVGEKQRLREELAAQTEEFLTRAKITEYAMGVSAEVRVLTSEKNKKAIKDGLEAKASARSGHLNIFTNADGSHSVNVARHYVGTFRLLKDAIEARDKYRETIGLLKAEK